MLTLKRYIIVILLLLQNKTVNAMAEIRPATSTPRSRTTAENMEEGSARKASIRTNLSAESDASDGKPKDGSMDKLSKAAPAVSSAGLKVLILLAFQNCSKNLLVRYVMKDQPKFLTSAAVVGSETTKFTLSVLWILLYERQSVHSIIEFLKNDFKTTLLVIVPASAYNLQLSLEYVAMANLDAAMVGLL